jgi:RimJ/RimL family protein N-acetyltransferase
MHNLLENELLTLRPATPGDKRKVFSWLANSNLTADMLGLPTFPDNPVPNWDEFDNDYQDYFFDGSQPLKGRCFIIIHNQQEIGQINYNDIDAATAATELDIWLADRAFTGQGFGTAAIRLLCNYLHVRFGCKRIYLQPSRRNPRALKAYQKAGFREVFTFPQHLVPDYYDAVLLVLHMD